MESALQILGLGNHGVKIAHTIVKSSGHMLDFSKELLINIQVIILDTTKNNL